MTSKKPPFRFSTAHTRSVDESYFEHFGKALWISAVLAKLAIIALIHAFLPQTFRFTVSGKIIKLAQMAKERREAGMS